LKFYASVRMEVRRKEIIKDGDKMLGSRTQVKIVKNKVAPPFKVAEFDIMYGEGISAIGNILDIAVDNDIIVKSGSWFSYGDQKIGQGRDLVKKWLTENPDKLAEIEAKVREKISTGSVKKETVVMEEA